MKLAFSLVVVTGLVAGGAPLRADRVADAQSSKTTLSPVESAPRIRGFSVALVLGEMQGSATPDNLPPGAKKALGDMRGFLPYKSFRLLDTQWILCCATGGFADMFPTTVAGRLRGEDEQEYQFGVTILNVSGAQLSVRFVMNHAAGSALKKISQAAIESRGLERAMVEGRLLEARRELRAHHVRPPQQETAGNAEGSARAKVETLERELHELTKAGGGGKGAVIDSTFSMDIGETVVIGTSSLKGEKALIAVLTAAPRTGSVPVK